MSSQPLASDKLSYILGTLVPNNNIVPLEEVLKDFPPIWEVPEGRDVGGTVVIIQDWPVIVEVPVDGSAQ